MQDYRPIKLYERPAITLAVFTLTIFMSSSLLFFVQPLFTRMVLPKLGGSPTVWATAMLFFQTALILGYLYAHLLARYMRVSLQMTVHAGLWVAALFFLPLVVPQDWSYDAGQSAITQTLGLYAAGVGVPFLLLAANAPLMQAWYARSDGHSAHDPYFLYGASNLGSLVALLAFPIAAEPFFGLTGISYGWAAGFVILGGGLLACGLISTAGQGPEKVEAAAAARARHPGMWQILYWGGLAFLPSSMMLVTTSKIALDKGSIPLIWVIPLALYLLTFILTFTNSPRFPERLVKIVFLASTIWLGVVFSTYFFEILDWTDAGLMILAFFGFSLFVHRQLYNARPHESHLTLFYLTMSVGGALGGVFNSIVAPQFFNDLFEGPVTLLIAAGVLFFAATRNEGKSWLFGILIPRAMKASVAVVAVLSFLTFALHQQAFIYKDRSFFGNHLVRDEGELRRYFNGTTLHGGQRLSELASSRPEPLFYYHRLGPIGQIMTSERGREATNIGVVGLGIGAMACHALPHQSWFFYEIDAQVDRIARNPALFSYMSSCTPDAPTYLGDARTVLEQQADKQYDILVIDAYSSDAVPLHLTTHEAMALYMDRLAPGGILVFHVSNRYYDLSLPLARGAEALGLAARLQEYWESEDVPGVIDASMDVILFARNAADFGDLGEDARWAELPGDGGRVWTDDHASLLSAMR